jgi:FKBP-type peptidyl-prolyl cis-trans isomerase SlyD
MNDDLNEPLSHITPQCVVALTWTLKDTLGEELDVLDKPVEFLVGGGDLLPKIDEALQGHEVGDSLDLHLEPEDAFGDFIDKLIFLEASSPKRSKKAKALKACPPAATPTPRPTCSTPSPRSTPSTSC